MLRPKPNGNQALFYSVITNESSEEQFCRNRQLFLTEQGYEYYIYSYQDFRDKFGTYVEIMKKMKELREAAPAK